MGEFVRLSSRSVILIQKSYRLFIFQINMRMQVASLLLLSAMMVQADKSSYPTTYDTTYYSQNNIAPYPEYDTSSSLQDQFGTFLSEKQSGVDLDTILAIGVFGGLGLGALAWVDSINHRNNLCAKLKEITKVARATASDGTTAAALSTSTSTGAGTAATVANTVMNSNRVFINNLAAISDLAC